MHVLIKLFLKLIIFYRIALKCNDKCCFHLRHFDSISWHQNLVTGVSKTYITIKYFVLGQYAFRKLIFELHTEPGKSGKPLYATNAIICQIGNGLPCFGMKSSFAS